MPGAATGPGRLRRAVSVVLEPYYYVGPGLILIALVMLVPLIVGIGYSFQNVQILNPFKTGWVGLQHYRELLPTRCSGTRSSTRSGGPSARSRIQFALGLGLGAAAERALLRPQAGAGAGVPALGGAELHLGPGLGLAVQPDHRPPAALAVRARRPGRAGQHPGRPRDRDVGADHRQCLVGRAVLRDHAAGRDPGDSRRDVRGGGDRRRRRLAALPPTSPCRSSRPPSRSPCSCARSGSPTSPT